MERPRPADRVRYYDGQRVTAGDLAEDSAYELWQRALHVRAVHDTWGVALGFDLVAASFPGPAYIGPGLAYDACARELLLSEPIALPLPDWQAGLVFDLVCSYRPPDDPSGVSSSVLCPGAAPDTRPAFRWVGANDSVTVRHGLDIVLGTYTVYTFRGVPEAAYSSLDRRDWARAAIRPRMDWGILQGRQLIWERFDGTQPCIRAVLETDRSGFSATPHYFGWLLDNPWFDSGELPPVVSIFQRELFVSIQLTFLDNYSEAYLAGTVQARLNETSLLWFGIEPFSGLWPTFTTPPAAGVDMLPAPLFLRSRGGTR